MWYEGKVPRREGDAWVTTQMGSAVLPTCARQGHDGWDITSLIPPVFTEQAYMAVTGLNLR